MSLLIFFVSWALQVLADPNPRPLFLSNNQLSFILPLHRSGNEAIFHVENASFVFDPSYMNAEIQKVSAKYQHASDILKGIYLNPEYKPLLTSAPPKSILGQGPASPLPLTNHTISPVFTPVTYAPVALTDFDKDIMYYGSLSIGTPPQELAVDIDTGSADLWVMAGCTYCTSPQKQFNKQASSTYRKADQDSFLINYGTGSITAERAVDIVTMQGLSIDNQSFGAAMQVSSDFDPYPISGILGMAFSSIAQSRQPTFFENLMNRGLVGRLFAVHLERQNPSGSELCLGCYNLDKTTGPITWIPVASQTYWTLNLEGISVDQTKIASNGILAAIDTGTTNIYLPGPLAKQLYSMIPGAMGSADQAFYTFPCSSVFTIAFQFGGHSFEISTADINLGSISSGSPDCVAGILGMDASFPSNLAIIGDLFLKNWYSLYDYDNGVRIGFAPSINNKSK